MAAFTTQNLFWAFTAVQVTGLLSAALARLAENRSSQASCQWLFLAALSLVALVTIASIAMDGSAWVLSGSTLAVMVVMAVWDPGPRTAASHQ